MLARVDSAELTDWIAYEQITGPLGPERLDILAGIIAATVHNASTDKKSRKAKPADFVPKWDQRKPQSWQEQLAAIRKANAALGGTDETETRRTAPMN